MKNQKPMANVDVTFQGVQAKLDAFWYDGDTLVWKFVPKGSEDVYIRMSGNTEPQLDSTDYSALLKLVENQDVEMDHDMSGQITLSDSMVDTTASEMTNNLFDEYFNVVQPPTAAAAHPVDFIDMDLDYSAIQTVNSEVECITVDDNDCEHPYECITLSDDDDDDDNGECDDDDDDENEFVCVDE